MKKRLLFRVHAVQRMFERRISLKNVNEAVESAITIEDYSAEMPEPSRLILGRQGNRPFHVVTSESMGTGLVTIITVYHPDPNQWSRDFKSRRA